MTRRYPKTAAELLGEEGPRPPTNKEAGNDSWALVRKGVTVAWLSQALNQDRKTIQRRLAECPVKLRGLGGFPIYDLSAAMSYLVKPKFDIEDYMRRMNPNELPPMLKKEFWQAKNQRALYMERAGELWHTEDVLEVLAEAFKHIKDTLQVLPDDLEREVDLKPKQYEHVQKRIDALRNELFKVLVEMPKDRQTRNLLTDSDKGEDRTDGDD